MNREQRMLIYFIMIASSFIGFAWGIGFIAAVILEFFQAVAPPEPTKSKRHED